MRYCEMHILPLRHPRYVLLESAFVESIPRKSLLSTVDHSEENGVLDRKLLPGTDISCIIGAPARAAHLTLKWSDESLKLLWPARASGRAIWRI